MITTFKSDNGMLEATVTYNGNVLEAKEFTNCVDALMHHLATHLGTAMAPEVYNQISRMKLKYLDDVLKFLVEVTYAVGGKVPEEVKQKLSKGAKLEWDPNESDQSSTLNDTNDL